MRVFRFIHRHRLILIYSLSLAVLVFLLKWLQWQFLILDFAMEIYVGAIALLFTGLGVWIARKLSNPPELREIQVYDHKVKAFTPDHSAIAQLGLSARELEVLELMAKGLSNAEIAQHLHLSLSTIKTHSFNLYRKMDVQRRTQAIDQAKKMGIIA